MNKPVSLIIDETKKSLADTINDCNLHPSIIEMIVKDIYWEINRLSIETIKKEKEQFLEESANEQTLFNEGEINE